MIPTVLFEFVYLCKISMLFLYVSNISYYFENRMGDNVKLNTPGLEQGHILFLKKGANMLYG